MRKALQVVMLVGSIGAGSPVQAQDSLKTTRLDELVVTGTRTEVPVEKSGKMIYKISAQQLRRSGARTVADALYRVPGVQMDGNFGTPGTNISYFVRGAASKRTLILIDGVPFNDPSGIDQTYDLRLLDINNVESIEVLRGGLSSLYGTGAAAAVIHIKTKQVNPGEMNASAGVEYGSFHSFANHWGVNGRIGKVSYLTNASYRSSDGISAAQGTGQAGFEADGMQSENAQMQVGYHFSDKWAWEVSANFDRLENDFDGGAFMDDDVSGSELIQKRVGSRLSYRSNNTTVTASHYTNLLERRINYGGFLDNYDGRNVQQNVQLRQQIGTYFSAIVGLDHQYVDYAQPGVQRTDFNSTDPYASLMFEAERFVLQAGGRLNVHSVYGEKSVYNINPAYNFDLGPYTLKVLANYSTSYITPSLYQLFGPFGNTDLKPEESSGGDVGASLLADDLEVNAVYFQRLDTRAIDFAVLSFDPFAGEYFNTDGRTKVEGVELDFRYQLSSFQFSGSFSWINNLQGLLRQRVPRQKAVMNVLYNYSQNGQVGVTYTRTGARMQINPETFTLVETGAFHLVDLNASQSWKKLTFYGAVNNLLNTQYDAILGFATLGRTYTMGVRMLLSGK